jgi:hypothetical protein
MQSVQGPGSTAYLADCIYRKIERFEETMLQPINVSSLLRTARVHGNLMLSIVLPTGQHLRYSTDRRFEGTLVESRNCTEVLLGDLRFDHIIDPNIPSPVSARPLIRASFEIPHPLGLRSFLVLI